MQRNAPFLLLAALFATLCLATVAQAALVAKIDRQRLALDETLTLTVSKDGSSFFSEPDLAPLEPDFTVISKNQSSSTQIINGQMSASVQWRFVLSPKRAGRLQIPPLTLGKDATAPLSVEVSQEAPSRPRADDQPLFLETEVDHREVWVQSQVIFTLRLLWAVPAQIQDPADPQLENAILEKLEDTTFDKMINGQSCKVFERRYAIFPQTSGQLTIPPMTVQAEVAGQHRSGAFFDPFGSRGKPVTLRSNSETITVRERPADYPTTAAWLPADKFSLDAQWSQKPDELKVGDSATLTITMVADGLPGAQLPPIQLPEMDTIKLYQNKAEVANHPTGQGITGSRQESMALVPTKPGNVELPEIRIPWWDKDKQQVQYAVLPATRLTVHGAPAAEPAAARPAEPAPPLQAPPTAPAVAPPPAPTARPTGWMALTLLLALAWLTTTCLWWRARRLAAAGQPLRPANPAVAMKEEEALQLLRRACQANDPLSARSAIIGWAAARWPLERRHTLIDIERLYPDPRLAALCQELDQTLYGHGEQAGTWQGQGILALVNKIRKNSRETRTKDNPLPPLYH